MTFCHNARPSPPSITNSSALKEGNRAMTPLSASILQLLEEIREALLRDGQPPDPLIRQLENQWQREKPGDNEGLQSLVKELRAKPDPARLADAPSLLEEALLQAKADLAAFDRMPLDDDELPNTERVAKIAAGEREGWTYPVFFGTDRKVIDASAVKLAFTSERAPAVTYGRCEVWIPATHRFGEIGRSFLKRWPRLEFDDDHLVLRSSNSMDEGAFWQSLKSEMDNSKPDKPHGLVFIHGYNTSFHDAVIRAAQVGFDLKVSGATALFSWPSQGTIQGYPADGAAVEGSEEAITNFLVGFAKRSGAEVVHVIAHSMGNRGLLRALQRISADAKLRTAVKFGQIFLAAPDVDRALFLSLAKIYPQFSDRTTLYSSDGDKAVAMSAWLHGWPRAGYFSKKYKMPVAVAEGVARLDSVAVPDFDLDLIGHSYFAQAEALLYDMLELMRHSTIPNKRPRIHQKDLYWEMSL
jgi:esterase/lipase superfamily enzyme